MSDPLISVIVPVYNASRWLDSCIQSILRQSLADYELLLIDDGSEDNSLHICEIYARQDPRIRVICKKNGGASSARNLGLDNAWGRWVVFVDSDDAVEEHYLRGLYDAVAASPKGSAPMGVAGFQMVDCDTGERIKSVSFNNQTFQKHEIARGFLDNEMFRRGHSCSKIYNRESINCLGLRFDEKISYGEDLIFMLGYLNLADHLVLVSCTDYIYRQSNSGLTVAYSSFDAEYHLLSLLKLHTFSLIGEQCNDQGWICWYSTLAMRALSCLYRPRFKRPRHERLRVLKRFSEEHSELLLKTSDARLQLLSKDRYLVFDARMATLFHLRYTILKQPWQMWIKFKNNSNKKRFG